MNAKTIARIDRAVAIIEAGSKSGVKMSVREIVELVCIEQDRDTRHACAEAVASMSNPYNPDDGGGHRGQSMFELAKTVAHAACMNVQAI